MGHNLRFWGRYSANVMFSILQAVLVMEAACLLGHGLEASGTLLPELRTILLISAAVIVFAANNGAQTTFIPLLLSHGETRKNVFIGHTVTKLATGAAVLLLSVVLALLSAGRGALKALPTETLVLACVCASGGIVGTLFVSARWLGTLLLILVWGGFGGTVGFLTVSSADSAKLACVLQEVMQAAPWWLYLMAAVLVCADLGYCWVVLRRREVRI